MSKEEFAGMEIPEAIVKLSESATIGNNAMAEPDTPELFKELKSRREFSVVLDFVNWCTVSGIPLQFKNPEEGNIEPHILLMPCLMKLLNDWKGINSDTLKIERERAVDYFLNEILRQENMRRQP